MIAGPRGAFFESEPVETGDIRDMRGGPAIVAIADIRRDALRASYSDQRGDEALLYRVVHLRQAHHGYVNPALHQRDSRHL